MEQQPAFAWLPLRSYGFRFIIQADWAVPSSREAILAESPLNQTLRRHLPDIFCNLIEELAASALKISQVQPRRKAFKRIYSLIPLVGEAREFFADIPKSILQLLMKKNFILVQDKGRHKLVSPGEVVRPELPKSVDAHLNDDVKRTLEVVLNQRGHYIPVEELSSSLAAAENLSIQHLSATVAFQCLDCLSRVDAGARLRSESDLGLLHVLFHVMACELGTMPKALFENLRGLAAIPTESGRLCSAESKVYIVDEAMAKTLRGYAEGLNLRFRQDMHDKVKSLFNVLGLQQTDGPRFLREVLVPMLTADTAASIHTLVNATRSARGILASMNKDQRKVITDTLQEKMWVAVDVVDARGLSSTRPVRPSQDVVHISHLPESFTAFLAGREWLTASQLYYAHAVEDPSPAFSWGAFWQDLGCWPAFSVETDEPSTLTASSQSRDLNCVMLALKRMQATPACAQKAALELVAWLAPHGSFYAKYFKNTSEAPLASMLFKTAWMPSWTGERLLAPHDGWVPVSRSDDRVRESRFLASSCFHRATEVLLDSWPCLHLARSPKANIIVRTLSYHAALPAAAWSTGEMASVYKDLSLACYKERIWAPRPDQEDEPSQESLEVREYLLHMPWIFLPDQRCGSLNPTDKETGRFFTSEEVVIRDMSCLLSDDQRRGRRVTNEMVRLVAQSVSVRTVREHYPDKNVLGFFKDWGVVADVGWEVYLEVLRLVDRLVSREDDAHVWENDHAYQVVWHVLEVVGYCSPHPVDEGPPVENRGQTADDHDQVQADQDGEETDASLQNFVEQARNLRICYTQSKRFRKPSAVEYVAADASSWWEEAQNFAAMLPSANEESRIAVGWRCLGLRRWKTWCAFRSILPEVTPHNALEAKLARAIILGGVRSALLKFEAQNKNMPDATRKVIRVAWRLAIAMKVACIYAAHKREESLLVQEVVALPASRLETCGVAALVEDEANTIMVSDREEVVVARMNAPVVYPFLAGFIRSAGKRQPAVALNVQSKIYTAYVIESHHSEPVDALFSELSHICPEAENMRKDDLKTIRKETARSLLAIAKQVKATQRVARLQEGVNVSAAVEDAMRKSGLKSNLSWDQIHNQHWGLSDALRIEPEEAWQKLVAGEDLWGSEEQDQEAAASSAPVDHAEAAESLHNPSDDGSHASQAGQEPEQALTDDEDSSDGEQ
ncbi:NOV, partial [Symbiodinium necroappetens]